MSISSRMSISSVRHGRRRRLAQGGAAAAVMATFGVLATGTASAASAPRDEWGGSGWITAGSGLGVATAACNPYWPTTFRHSITGEQLY